MNVATIEYLFQSAELIANKSDELKRAKGETFNVFSILGMETKENDTHSNFIGNLLHPKGTHLLGTVFLERFLECVDMNNHLDVDSTQVYLEFSCGRISNESKTGGRIDIYLVDGNGKSISIENKVYAGDQYQQIERYVNFNYPNNKVLYLTLDGKDASKASRGDLEAGNDYWLISYKNTIIGWLELCIKEAASEPIVRETIKQYQILIKQLTKTMEGESRSELQELILKNYRAAELIARNFDQAKEVLCTKLRKAVVARLNQSLEQTSYRAREGTKITTSYAQIWISNENNKGALVYFGMEPFGTTASTPIFIGTFTYGDTGFEQMNGVEKHNQYWSNLRKVPEFNGISLNVNNTEFVEKLFTSDDFFEGVVEHLSSRFMSYFDDYKQLIEDYLVETKGI